MSVATLALAVATIAKVGSDIGANRREKKAREKAVDDLTKILSKEKAADGLSKGERASVEASGRAAAASINENTQNLTSGILSGLGSEANLGNLYRINAGAQAQAAKNAKDVQTAMSATAANLERQREQRIRDLEQEIISVKSGNAVSAAKNMRDTTGTALNYGFKLATYAENAEGRGVDSQATKVVAPSTNTPVQ